MIPLGIAVALRLIPAPVMADARARPQAATYCDAGRWIVAVLIALVWLVLLGLVARAIL